jgi:hypothetical protein
LRDLGNAYAHNHDPLGEVARAAVATLEPSRSALSRSPALGTDQQRVHVLDENA